MRVLGRHSECNLCLQIGCTLILTFNFWTLTLLAVPRWIRIISTKFSDLASVIFNYRIEENTERQAENTAVHLHRPYGMKLMTCIAAVTVEWCLVWSGLSLACREEAWAAARLSDDVAGCHAGARHSGELCTITALPTWPVSRVRRQASIQSWQRHRYDTYRWLHGSCCGRQLNKPLPSYCSPRVFRCWWMLDKLSLYCGVLLRLCYVIWNVVDFSRYFCSVYNLLHLQPWLLLITLLCQIVQPPFCFFPPLFQY